MTTYIIIGLSAFIILQKVCSFIERRRYLKLIDQLSDKVMSRNYQDYVYGQETKKEEKAEEAVLRSRSDEDEAFIERKNKELEGLEEKAIELEKQLDKYTEVG